MPSPNNPNSNKTFPKSLTEPTREQNAIINNIAVKYLDNYGDWLKIMWGLFNTFHNIELCDRVSKKSSKYSSKKEVIKYIACDKQNVISFGTISHYSKISDPERHEDIFFEYHIEDIMSFGDKSLADAYINLKNDNLIKLFINLLVLQNTSSKTKFISLYIPGSAPVPLCCGDPLAIESGV